MKNYYIGLDIGTNSIGWAVANEEYEIPKFKGNAMWGIRLLEESKTAEMRRNFRSERRRRQRSKYRLKCLEMLFQEEIAKIDIAFFQRLKDSAYYLEDKKSDGKYALFNDLNYSDIDYYKEYPTIYHLRKDLIVSKSPHDIRHVFLAVSHIIKNRGHFLFDTDGMNFSGNNLDFSNIWQELNLFLMDNYDSELYCSNSAEIEQILKDRTLTPSKKKEALSKLFGLNKKEHRFEMAVVTLLSGGTARANDIFASGEYNDAEVKSITFKSGYDEKAAVYESAFGENFYLIEKIKAVYDWAVLADILKGKEYISFAKVQEYEKHHSDLKLLKEYVKKYIPQKYNLIFNENKSSVCNYLAYSGHSKKEAVVKKCTQIEFCDFLKKHLPSLPVEDTYAGLYDEINAGTFCPKIVSQNNSVIPMQINRRELVAILENAKKYFPFLTQSDENGKIVADKVLAIFDFRVPYYVGPLNPHSPKSWIVRTKEKIYPWNLEEVVDFDKSAENFIDQLTNKCTYLPKEDVIPKNSLLYSSFMVLNELNNLRLDGEKINVELKQAIYHDLFEKRNKVTIAALKNYLKIKGFSPVEITGIDGEFKGNLKSYKNLEEYPSLTLSEKEEIIRAITIFGDDKKLLKKRLKCLYGQKLTDDEIARIGKLKYTGWSRLSKKLLTGMEALLPETGELTDIIHALWKTNENFMQLLSQKYDFSKKIEEENGVRQFTSLKEEVEGLYVSPKVKRPVYQALQIVEELVKIQGCVPKKIFVEVARFEGEKVRTVSRKQKLIDLYSSCKNEEKILFEQLCNTSEDEFKKDKFRKDKLYLYYTQFGKCIYTGQPIDIANINDTNIYDIDHIFPQSKIKDDSIDNRVLVLKTVNEGVKRNNYPISQDIRAKMMPFWKILRARDLISQKKFERLTRSTPLSDEELASFIDRQLVETRQSTKAVSQLLKMRYPDTSIEYIKAGLVSDFRNEFKLYKCREVNDFHHAKDAYLNIVVGNVYTVKARQPSFISDLQQNKCSLNKMFAYPVKGAWQTENNKSINIVKSTMAKNNIRFTRYAFKRKGELFKQKPLKKGSGQVPRKKNSPLCDIAKYGGYNKPMSAYFVFIEYVDLKGKTYRSFESVDAYMEREYLKNPEQFLREKLGAKSVKIIIPCVKYNSLISLNGFKMHISCKTSGGAAFGCKPAEQLVLGKQEDYVKRIAKYLNKCAALNREKEITESDKIHLDENIQLYDRLIEKLTKTVYKEKFIKLGNTLHEKKDKFFALSLYQQCVLLMQILQIVHCNVLSGDLSLIGESKHAGKTKISNKLQPGYTSCKLINQSVTGLFENEVDLMK